MSNAKVGWKNLVDSALVTASASLNSQGVGNLLAADVVKAWNAGTNSAYLLADFGNPVALDGTALIGTNLTPAATCRVRVSTADATGAAGDALDTGAVAAGVDPTYGSLVSLFSTTVTGRYLRIDLADASLSSIAAGRWWAGPLVQPERNFAYGWKRGINDASQRSQTPGGQSHTNRLAQRRTIDVTFQWLTESECQTFAEDLLREVGLFGDLLLILNPDSTNLGRDALWGQLAEMTDISNPFFHRYAVELSVIERK